MLEARNLSADFFEAAATASTIGTGFQVAKPLRDLRHRLGACGLGPVVVPDLVPQRLKPARLLLLQRRRRRSLALLCGLLGSNWAALWYASRATTSASQRSHVHCYRRCGLFWEELTSPLTQPGGEKGTRQVMDKDICREDTYVT